MDVIREMIERAIQAAHDRREEVCEMSLVDPEQRGVLITQNRFKQDIKVELSTKVPYGHIYVL